MKRSEAEWLQQFIDRVLYEHETADMDSDLPGCSTYLTNRLLAALKRRGWTPPKKAKEKKCVKK